MITNFHNWLVEGTPANWQPSGRIGAGGDPTVSALAKIDKNQGQMPFDGGFAGSNVIQIRFGLDNEELAALNKLKLIVKDETGFHIDKNRFYQIYKQLTGVTPTINKMPTMSPMPMVQK